MLSAIAITENSTRNKLTYLSIRTPTLTSDWLPPANEVYEGSVFTGVCLSVGVSVQGCSVQGVSVQGGLCLGSLCWGYLPGGDPCHGDPCYGNMRVVRILLQCILVRK